MGLGLKIGGKMKIRIGIRKFWWEYICFLLGLGSEKLWAEMLPIFWLLMSKN